MKILFPLPTDNKRHRYCQNCYSERVHDELNKGKRVYRCDNCHNIYNRLIDLDPRLVSWIDKKTKDYWHESVGVFVKNTRKEILFIERIIYPFGYTIPAGHLETGEKPMEAAIRELKEETGITAKTLIHFKDIDIDKDPCHRGAGSHRWHIYKYLLKNDQKILTDPEEGKSPVWLSIKKALSKKLTHPVKCLLQKYGNNLILL